MSIFDLTKATIVCGGVAFLFYSFPVIAQVVTISSLAFLWLAYAHQAFANLRRR